MDYGVRMLSCRKIDPETVYLRVSNIVLPCHGFIPTGGLKGNPEGYTIHSHVPIDDTHSMRYNIHFRRTRPIHDDERQHDDEIGADFHKRRNLDNNYLQDREQQKRETFTGMGQIFLIHDSCAIGKHGADLRPLPRASRRQRHDASLRCEDFFCTRFAPSRAARSLPMSSEARRRTIYDTSPASPRRSPPAAIQKHT